MAASTGPPSMRRALAVGLVLGALQCRSAPEDAAPETHVAPSGFELAGTSWQLVEFQGGDGTVLRPDDPAKYTITFGAHHRVAARIDCNRGTATWESAEPPHLEFGPLALTRAACPPGSLHDHLVRQWPYVRSYVMREGHLFLSLMADGGIYEFAPIGSEGSRRGKVRRAPIYRDNLAKRASRPSSSS